MNIDWQVTSAPVTRVCAPLPPAAPPHYRVSCLLWVLSVVTPGPGRERPPGNGAPPAVRSPGAAPVTEMRRPGGKGLHAVTVATLSQNLILIQVRCKDSK